MSQFTVIIPARYGSTRLPGKVLLPVAGRPLIEHVYLAARQSGASRVLVATDDQRVLETCRGFGAEALMTDAHHQSGTDRLAQCVELLELGDEEIVVNLQGDEPLTPPQTLQTVAQALIAHPRASIATLCSPIDSAEELHNPNAVKVVTDKEGYALYFSRAPIPWDREAFAADPRCLPNLNYWRHVGIYAYRVGFLKEISALPQSAAEQAECLEQLRALHQGARIHVSELDSPIPAGVDTPEDLERVTMALN